MRKQLLLLLFLVVPTLHATVQQPNATIEKVEVSGLPEQRLSAELRSDMQKLVGQVYNAAAADPLAEGVQIEIPEYVAAAKPFPGSQPNRVRLVFVVAKIADNDALKVNINARYIVESVEVEGKSKPKISDVLNADLQKMVGEPLDNVLAGKMVGRISSENGDKAVQRKLRRGAAPERVKIVYEVVGPGNNISFNWTFPAYHSKQGFSADSADGSMGGGSWKNSTYGQISFRAYDDANRLTERYAGVGYGYDVQFRRFHVDLNYSSLRAQWKSDTLRAARLSAGEPGLYRLRDTIGTSVRITLPLKLDATVGALFSVLQMQSPAPHFEADRVLTGSLGRTYTATTDSHRSEGSWKYGIHAGAGGFGSDFIYTRHEWNFDYKYQIVPRPSFQALQVKFIGGRVTGNAPLFERFSLGSATTLRGWNKYEIAPLGGNRVAYASAEYNYHFITPIYDVGTIWDAGQPAKVRQSVGIRLSGTGTRVCPKIQALTIPVVNTGFNPLCMSLTIAAPIRSGPAKPMFMLGFGF